MNLAERLGIIDLGSNSCRLSIYDIGVDGTYRPVYEMKQNVRLAHNLSRSGNIPTDGISRAVACTKLFVRTGKLLGVSRWVAVATAAVRQANNRSEVLDVLMAETTLAFRVITGQEEGRYGYLGVINTLDIHDALMFDIGGASSELMYVRDRQLREVVSLPYGALNLREMFNELDEPDAAKRAMETVAAALDNVPWLQDAKGLPMVGLGGTARAVAKLHMALHQREGERLHGYLLDAPFVASEFEHLQTMSVAKRGKVKGISKSRAEILVAGFAAVHAISDRITPSHFIISRNGLREGIFFEALLQKESAPVLSSVLEHSVSNFQRVYDVNLNVAEIVTNCALELFDQLQDIHRLSERDRKLLWVTTQIESCGCYINTEKWTKHSAYLALSSYLYGLTSPEILDLASMLSGQGDIRIRQLMTLLRLAKLLTLQLGLDPKDTFVELRERTLSIGYGWNLRETVDVSADSQVEEDFKELFGCEIQFLEKS